MLLGDFQSKDVINVVDGSKLGRVSNLEFDPNTGKIISITVQPNTRLASFFSSNNNSVIPWNQIVKIGGEVIIVNYNNY
jgi:YlmC/YmxH family sporulation protein